MRLSVLITSTILLGSKAVAGLVAEDYFQTFSNPPPPGSNASCPPQCDTDKLPGPVKALEWKNLETSYLIGRFSSGRLYDVAPYDGYFYASLTNASRAAVLTSRYNGSHVKEWELKSFAFGCSALQRVFDPAQNTTVDAALAANCTVIVEGFDGAEGRVGREVFDYGPYPLTPTVLGYPIGLMTRYNTTSAGLKGKRVKKVKIKGKLKSSPGVVFINNFAAGIDAVSYTVYNKTAS